MLTTKQTGKTFCVLFTTIQATKCSSEQTRKSIEDIKQQLKLNSLQDWNNISQKQLQQIEGGRSLLSKYSLFNIKCLGYPEGKSVFKPIKEPGYWEKRENIESFLIDLKKILNLQTPKDWNSITKTQIQENGGSGLFKYYSIYDIKCIACPEGKSYFVKRKPKEIKGYWEIQENIQQFIDSLRQKLNLRTLNDWNLISQKQIQQNGGSGLLSKYSMYEIKCLGYPEGKSTFSKRKPKKVKGYWENNENIQYFLDNLREKLHLNTPNDWNLLTVQQIHENGGGKLLNNFTMYELKCLGCPEGKSNFKKQNSPKFWHTKDNITNFIKKLKETFHLETANDWNLLSQANIISAGGKRLLNLFSLFEIKCIGHPEGILLYDKPNKKKPNGYWENPENVNQFIKKLQEKLNVRTNEDWNRISVNQIQFFGGSGLISKNRNFLLNLETRISYKINKRSNQRWLFLQIQKLFPHEEIVEDYFHSEISRETGFSVQFDIFMVQRNIAIEYHGKQHYEDIPTLFSSLEMYQYRDSEKRRLCNQFKIDLIIIPYWWDNKLSSLNQYFGN